MFLTTIAQETFKMLASFFDILKILKFFSLEDLWTKVVREYT